MAKRTPKKPSSIHQKVDVNTPVTPEGMRSRTGTADKPCDNAKGKKCATQLVFIDGSAFLRFCTKPKSKGMMVPIESPKQANDFAKQYCACVTKNRGKNKKGCAVKVTGMSDAPLGLGRFERKPVRNQEEIEMARFVKKGYVIQLGGSEMKALNFIADRYEYGGPWLGGSCCPS